MALRHDELLGIEATEELGGVATMKVLAISANREQRLEDRLSRALLNLTDAEAANRQHVHDKQVLTMRHDTLRLAHRQLGRTHSALQNRYDAARLVALVLLLALLVVGFHAIGAW